MTELNDNINHQGGNNEYDKFIQALSDERLSFQDLIAVARRYYESSGCPYGDTDIGLALWIESITGTTTN